MEDGLGRAKSTSDVRAKEDAEQGEVKSKRRRSTQVRPEGERNRNTLTFSHDTDSGLRSIAEEASKKHKKKGMLRSTSMKSIVGSKKKESSAKEEERGREREKEPKKKSKRSNSIASPYTQRRKQRAAAAAPAAPDDESDEEEASSLAPFLDVKTRGLRKSKLMFAVRIVEVRNVAEEHVGKRFALSWRRGIKKENSGKTPKAFAAVTGTIMFDKLVNCMCTMKQSTETGQFQEKSLAFVLRREGRASKLSVVGTAVIDLAAYAAEQNKTHTVTVQLTKAGGSGQCDLILEVAAMQAGGEALNDPIKKKRNPKRRRSLIISSNEALDQLMAEEARKAEESGAYTNVVYSDTSSVVAGSDVDEEEAKEEQPFTGFDMVIGTGRSKRRSLILPLKKGDIEKEALKDVEVTVKEQRMKLIPLQAVGIPTEEEAVEAEEMREKRLKAEEELRKAHAKEQARKEHELFVATQRYEIQKMRAEAALVNYDTAQRKKLLDTIERLKGIIAKLNRERQEGEMTAHTATAEMERKLELVTGELATVKAKEQEAIAQVAQLKEQVAEGEVTARGVEDQREKGVREMQANVEEAQRQREELEAKLAAVMEERDAKEREMQEKLAALEEQLAAANTQVADVTEEAKKAQRQADSLQEELERVKALLAAAEEEKAATKTALEAKVTEHDGVVATMRGMEAEAQALRYSTDDVGKGLAQARALLATRDQELLASSRLHAEADSRNKELEAEVVEAKKEAEEKIQALRSATAALEDSTAAHERSQKELTEALGKASTLEASLQEAVAANAVLKAAVAEKEAALASAKAEAEAEKKKREEEEAEAAAKMEEIAKQLQEREKALAGLTAEYDSWKETASKAKQELAAQLTVEHSMVEAKVGELATAQASMEGLRAQFAALEENHTAQFGELMRQRGELEESLSSARVDASTVKEELAAKEAAVEELAKEKAAVEESKAALAASLAAVQEEVASLTAEKETAAKELAAIQEKQVEEKETYEAKIHDFEQLKGTLNVNLEQLRMDLALGMEQKQAAEEEKTQLAATVRQHEEANEAAEKKTEELLAAQAKLAEELTEKEAKLAELTEEKAAKETQLAETEAAREAERETYEAQIEEQKRLTGTLNIELEQLKVDLMAGLGQRETADSENNSLKEKLKEHIASEAALADTVASLTAEKESVAAAFAASKAEAEELQQKEKEKAAEVAALAEKHEEERQTFEARITEHQQLMGTLTIEMDQLKIDLLAAQKGAEEEKEAKEKLTGEVADVTSASQELQRSLKEAKETAERLEAELAERKAECQQLEGVRERSVGLEQSKAELQDTIDRLTAEVEVKSGQCAASASRLAEVEEKLRAEEEKVATLEASLAAASASAEEEKEKLAKQLKEEEEGRASEKEEHQAKVAALEEELATKEGELQQARQQHEEHSREKSDLSRQLGESSAIADEVTSLKGDVTSLTEQVETLTASLEEQTATVEERTDQVVALKEALAAAESEKKEGEAALLAKGREHEEEMATLRKGHETNVAELKEQLAARETELGVAVAEKEEKEKAKKQLTLQLQEATTVIEKFEAEKKAEKSELMGRLQQVAVQVGEHLPEEKRQEKAREASEKGEGEDEVKFYFGDLLSELEMDTSDLLRYTDELKEEAEAESAARASVTQRETQLSDQCASLEEKLKALEAEKESLRAANEAYVAKEEEEERQRGAAAAAKATEEEEKRRMDEATRALYAKRMQELNASLRSSQFQLEDVGESNSLLSDEVLHQRLDAIAMNVVVENIYGADAGVTGKEKDATRAHEAADCVFRSLTAIPSPEWTRRQLCRVHDALRSSAMHSRSNLTALCYWLSLSSSLLDMIQELEQPDLGFCGHVFQTGVVPLEQIDGNDEERQWQRLVYDIYALVMEYLYDQIRVKARVAIINEPIVPSFKMSKFTAERPVTRKDLLVVVRELMRALHGTRLFMAIARQVVVPTYYAINVLVFHELLGKPDLCTGEVGLQIKASLSYLCAVSAEYPDSDYRHILEEAEGHLEHVTEAANFFITISNAFAFPSANAVKDTFPKFNLAHIKHFIDMYSNSGYEVQIPDRVQRDIEKACVQAKALGKMPLYLQAQLDLVDLQLCEGNSASQDWYAV